MAKDKVYTADMGQPPQDVDGSGGGGGYRSPSALETIGKVGGPAALVAAGGAGGNPSPRWTKKICQSKLAAESSSKKPRVA
jgi:hypothetical protein